MAAEDWIDWMGLGEVGYINDDFENHPDDMTEPKYTDRFTFNGRRKRTRRQRQIVRENKFIYGEQW